MAECLEEFQDHLQAYFMGWMLDNVSKTKEEMDTVQSFFEYAYKEAQEAIVTPRRGGSYQECRRTFPDELLEPRET